MQVFRATNQYSSQVLYIYVQEKMEDDDDDDFSGF